MGKFDRKHIAAVWDVAHCALTGEGPELAADIVWDRLCLVNFKNAFWLRRNGPEAEHAEWQHYWTTGRQGLAPWHRAAKALKGRGYRGAICLTAEYSDEAAVDRDGDIVYAKALF
jgi:sugar phosphate isomerase/epimerase